MFFKKTPKIPQEEIDQAETFLILKYGSIKESALNWSYSSGDERKRNFSPAQTEVIFVYFRSAKNRTGSTGPL